MGWFNLKKEAPPPPPVVADVPDDEHSMYMIDDDADAIDDDDDDASAASSEQKTAQQNSQSSSTGTTETSQKPSSQQQQQLDATLATTGKSTAWQKASAMQRRASSAMNQFRNPLSEEDNMDHNDNHDYDLQNNSIRDINDSFTSSDSNNEMNAISQSPNRSTDNDEDDVDSFTNSSLMGDFKPVDGASFPSPSEASSDDSDGSDVIRVMKAMPQDSPTSSEPINEMDESSSSSEKYAVNDVNVKSDDDNVSKSSNGDSDDDAFFKRAQMQQSSSADDSSVGSENDLVKDIKQQAAFLSSNDHNNNASMSSNSSRSAEVDHVEELQRNKGDEKSEKVLLDQTHDTMNVSERSSASAAYIKLASGLTGRLFGRHTIGNTSDSSGVNDNEQAKPASQRDALLGTSAQSPIFAQRRISLYDGDTSEHDDAVLDILDMMKKKKVARPTIVQEDEEDSKDSSAQNDSSSSSLASKSELLKASPDSAISNDDIRSRAMALLGDAGGNDGQDDSETGSACSHSGNQSLISSSTHSSIYDADANKSMDAIGGDGPQITAEKRRNSTLLTSSGEFKCDASGSSSPMSTDSSVCGSDDSLAAENDVRLQCTAEPEITPNMPPSVESEEGDSRHDVGDNVSEEAKASNARLDEIEPYYFNDDDDIIAPTHNESRSLTVPESALTRSSTQFAVNEDNCRSRAMALLADAGSIDEHDGNDVGSVRSHQSASESSGSPSTHSSVCGSDDSLAAANDDDVEPQLTAEPEINPNILTGIESEESDDRHDVGDNVSEEAKASNARLDEIEPYYFNDSAGQETLVIADELQALSECDPQQAASALSPDGWFGGVVKELPSFGGSQHGSAVTKSAKILKSYNKAGIKNVETPMTKSTASFNVEKLSFTDDDDTYTQMTEGTGPSIRTVAGAPKSDPTDIGQPDLVEIDDVQKNSSHKSSVGVSTSLPSFEPDVSKDPTLFGIEEDFDVKVDKVLETKLFTSLLTTTAFMEPLCDPIADPFEILEEKESFEQNSCLIPSQENLPSIGSCNDHASSGNVCDDKPQKQNILGSDSLPRTSTSNIEEEITSSEFFLPDQSLVVGTDDSESSGSQAFDLAIAKNLLAMDCSQVELNNVRADGASISSSDTDSDNELLTRIVSRAQDKNPEKMSPSENNTDAGPAPAGQAYNKGSQIDVPPDLKTIDRGATRDDDDSVLDLLDAMKKQKKPMLEHGCSSSSGSDSSISKSDASSEGMANIIDTQPVTKPSTGEESLSQNTLPASVVVLQPELVLVDVKAKSDSSYESFIESFSSLESYSSYETRSTYYATSSEDEASVHSDDDSDTGSDSKEFTGKLVVKEAPLLRLENVTSMTRNVIPANKQSTKIGPKSKGNWGWFGIGANKSTPMPTGNIGEITITKQALPTQPPSSQNAIIIDEKSKDKKGKTKADYMRRKMRRKTKRIVRKKLRDTVLPRQISTNSKHSHSPSKSSSFLSEASDTSVEIEMAETSLLREDAIVAFSLAHPTDSSSSGYVATEMSPKTLNLKDSVFSLGEIPLDQSPPHSPNKSEMRSPARAMNKLQAPSSGIPMESPLEDAALLPSPATKSKKQLMREKKEKKLQAKKTLAAHLTKGKRKLNRHGDEVSVGTTNQKMEHSPLDDAKLIVLQTRSLFDDDDSDRRPWESVLSTDQTSKRQSMRRSTRASISMLDNFSHNFSVSSPEDLAAISEAAEAYDSESEASATFSRSQHSLQSSHQSLHRRASSGVVENDESSKARDRMLDGGSESDSGAEDSLLDFAEDDPRDELDNMIKLTEMEKEIEEFNEEVNFDDMWDEVSCDDSVAQEFESKKRTKERQKEKKERLRAKAREEKMANYTPRLRLFEKKPSAKVKKNKTQGDTILTDDFLTAIERVFDEDDAVDDSSSEDEHIVAAEMERNRLERSNSMKSLYLNTDVSVARSVNSRRDGSADESDERSVRSGRSRQSRTSRRSRVSQRSKSETNKKHNEKKRSRSKSRRRKSHRPNRSMAPKIDPAVVFEAELRRQQNSKVLSISSLKQEMADRRGTSVKLLKKEFAERKKRPSIAVSEQAPSRGFRYDGGSGDLGYTGETGFTSTKTDLFGNRIDEEANPFSHTPKDLPEPTAKSVSGLGAHISRWASDVSISSLDDLRTVQSEYAGHTGIFGAASGLAAAAMASMPESISMPDMAAVQGALGSVGSSAIGAVGTVGSTAYGVGSTVGSSAIGAAGTVGSTAIGAAGAIGSAAYGAGAHAVGAVGSTMISTFGHVPSTPGTRKKGQSTSVRSPGGDFGAGAFGDMPLTTITEQQDDENEVGLLGGQNAWGDEGNMASPRPNVKGSMSNRMSFSMPKMNKMSFKMPKLPKRGNNGFQGNML
jgi:hypothetical protein